MAPKKPGATKSELFNQLITFVQITLGHLCLTCKASYLPYSEINRSDGEDEVSCFICSIPAHKGCVKKEYVNTENGLVFLCEYCLLHKGKDDVPVDDPTIKPPPPLTKDESDSADSTSSDSEDEDSATNRNKGRKKKEKQKLPGSESGEDRSQPLKRICRFYTRGNCKHGIFGTRDGKCGFDHPPMCKPYQQYGRRGPNGCKGDCNLWHPKLCYKALDFGECLNSECKFWHVKGTRRTTEQHPISHLPQQHQASLPPQQYRSAQRPSQNPHIPQVQTTQTTNHFSEQSFLESAKSQIDQMVRSQQAAMQQQMSFYMNNLMKQMQQQMLAASQRQMQAFPQQQMQVPIQQVQQSVPVQFMQPTHS